MAGCRWGFKTPHCDGFYWIVDKQDEVRLVKVVNFKRGMVGDKGDVFFFTSEMEVDLEDVVKQTVQWAGPIEPPEGINIRRII